MMNLGEFLENSGKTLFEAPLASSADADEPPELAEIRLAVLDQIREKSYRSGGKKVFPYDLLRVELRGVEESRRDVFAGRFFRKYIEQEVRGALRDGGCRFPENLRVDVERDARAAAARRGMAGGGDRLAGARRRGEAVGAADRARRHGQRCRDPPGQGAHQHRPRGGCVPRAKDCSAATIWRSPRTPRSTARSRASMRTFSSTAPPASTVCSTTAGMRAAKSARRMRHMDRARRHEPGSAPQRARHEAGTGRRDPLRQAVVVFEVE